MAKRKPKSIGDQILDDIAQGHKLAKVAHKVDSTVYMGEVLASGKPKRIEKYFIRKLAYKLFAKLMGRTINRI